MSGQYLFYLKDYFNLHCSSIFELSIFPLQAIACSLYVVGFGESISALIHQENPWVSRGIAIAVVLLLLCKFIFLHLYNHLVGCVP